MKFWRDVLGFELRGSDADSRVDLVSGAARVRLGERDWPPDFSGEGTRPGSAIVFFETDSIEAMQSAIRRRGGDPSHVENVNWLKMRVFEIRDPDGHVLWFGQSYHRESPARPRGMLRKVMPELPVDEVPAGVSGLPLSFMSSLTIRLMSANGKGFSNAAFTMLNTPVAAAIPTARETTAVAAKPGLRRKIRSA
jgi:hypothetical protein